MPYRLVAGCFAGFAVDPVAAEKDADLKLLISKATKPVVQEKFDGPKLPKGWVVNKGDFQIREGTIAGWEKKEDMHAAVLTLQKPFKNSILRFSFKRDGVTGFNLSFNHPKGHLFRILINDDGLQVNKDKDKKDAASKALCWARRKGNSRRASGRRCRSRLSATRWPCNAITA